MHTNPLIRREQVPKEAETIVSISIGKWSVEDKLIWGLHIKDIFIVKSAYYVAVQS